MRDAKSPPDDERDATLPSIAPWRTVVGTEERSWFLTTWGTATDDRYVGGGEPEDGAIYHFDGREWAEVVLPDETRLVNWLHGFAPDDIFAVTNEGGALHFDGNEWQAMATPTTENLWGIWGAAPDALWAVGGSGETGAKATLLFFDGEAWAEVETSIERPGVRAYFKVWGTAEDNIYIVGQNGVMQHFDGENWTELNVGASDDLIALWGTGPDNIVAVGGRSSAVVSHFDGKAWTTQTLFSTPGANGVWMQEHGTAHLALTQGYLARLSIPDLTVTLDPSDDFLDFHAIYGTPDGVLTAVALNPEASLTAEYAGVVAERELSDNE